MTKEGNAVNDTTEVPVQSDEHEEKILEILTLDHKLGYMLKKVCQPVTPDEYDDCMELAIEMHKATYRKGVGLAANQVGVDRRIIIVMRNAVDREFLMLINPVIVSRGKTVTYDWEGCLSCPKKMARIERHQIIDVEYIDKVNGKWDIVRNTFKRDLAVVIQHEIDHLDGKLISDGMEDAESKDTVTVPAT